ncbi:MAG: tetratricopeptide repeat protein [Candidatus Omnitrophica bacterium]|nr:tetratricopeptide repeat protein [Candidatus Omnitrophota bacterium]
MKTFLSFMLAALCFVVFFQVRENAFLSLDDDLYVSENPYIRDGLTVNGLRWAFTAGLLHTSKHTDYWQPFTFISRMLDFQFVGGKAAGHHCVNLVLHILNVLLLFFLLQRSTGRLWPSFAAACLFGVHPLAVEPVSWVTARKDVLGWFFGLLCLHAYLSYRRSSGGKWYAGCLAAFVAALLSKPAMIVLPGYLVIVEFWVLRPPLLPAPLPNITRGEGVSRVIPFCLIALLYAGIPFISQRDVFPYKSGVEIVSHVFDRYFFFLQKFFWPAHLWIYGGMVMPVFNPFILTAKIFSLAGISILAYRMRQRFPFLLAGWLWFVVGLIPVAGLEWPADRFMYVPMVGLIVMVVWSGAEWQRGWPKPAGVWVATISVLIAVCAGLSFQQGRFWRDSPTLFAHALAMYPDNYWAHNSLGVTLTGANKLDEAKRHFQRAIELRPNDAKQLTNMASLLIKQGQYEPAYPYAKKGYELDPFFPAAINNLALVFERRGNMEDAVCLYLKGLANNPQDPTLRENFANFLKNAGQNGPRQDGVYTRHYQNKAVSQEVKFVQGKMEGFYRVYLPDGDLVLEQEYKNGIPVGKPKRYYQKKVLGDYVPQ